LPVLGRPEPRRVRGEHLVRQYQRPVRAQPSYDKQFVRDWLTDASGWDRTGPPPLLPDAVIERTREKYVQAFERLTGRRFESEAR
jgi:phosphoribosylaminoimidazole-succinocarboxamide synthase